VQADGTDDGQVRLEDRTAVHVAEFSHEAAEAATDGLRW
jgi:hypothetical protein